MERTYLSAAIPVLKFLQVNGGWLVHYNNLVNEAGVLRRLM